MFADTTKPIVLLFYQGEFENNFPVITSRIIAENTTVKIVTEFRFGHVGITDDLDDADIRWAAVVKVSELKNLRGVKSKVHSAAGIPMSKARFLKTYPLLHRLWRAESAVEIMAAKKDLSYFLKGCNEK